MTTYTTLQTGLETAGVWADGVLPQTLTSTNYLGVRWDFTVLSPLLLPTSFDLAVTVGTTTSAVLQVWCPLLDHRLAAWTTAKRPSTRTNTSVGSRSGSFVDTVTYVLPLTIDRVNTLARRYQGAEPGDWNGSLPMVLASSATIEINDLTLTSTEVQAFTGLVGHVYAEGRADFCPRCGQPSTRDRWVRDGYTTMMVCEKCYDPPDEYGKVQPRPERPPLGED